MPPLVFALLFQSTIHLSPSVHRESLLNCDKAITQAVIWLSKKRSIPFDLGEAAKAYELQPEDSTDFGRIQIDRNQSIVSEIRIQKRLETSAILLSEGCSHLELTSWKHGHSSWIDLKESPSGQYRLKMNLSNYSGFPSASRDELVDAVRQATIKYAAEDKTRWLTIASGCSTVAKGPWQVATTCLELRIQVRCGSSWKTVMTKRINTSTDCC